MLVQNVSQVNFDGKFRYGHMKSKQKRELDKILTTEINGVSNEKLLKKMPFDVDVYCPNPTRKAIYPRFTFYIQHKKRGVPLFGMIKLNSKNPLEENVADLSEFITSAKVKIDSIKGNEKMTPAQELEYQMKILMGL